MSRPVVLIAEPLSEIAIEERRSIEDRYGDVYDVKVVATGEEADREIKSMTERNESLALLIIDAALNQDALQTLADTEMSCRVVMSSGIRNRNSALDAVFKQRANDAVLNSRPNEQEFNRVIAEQLEGWLAHDDPALQRVVIIGPRWSARVHELKEYLTMAHIPFSWEDSDRDNISAAHRKLQRNPSVPVAMLPSGKIIADPTIEDLALALDISRLPKRPVYDVVVVGGGPAGLGAAVHAGAEGLSTLILERYITGGQAGHSSRIQNYLGFPNGISGGELMEKGLIQSLFLGAEVVSPTDVTGLEDLGQVRRLTTADGQVFFARSVILASGVQFRKLPAKGADDLMGRGVYYGASTAEVPAFKDENVVIVGGANSAGQAAMKMAEVAKKVTILVRDPKIESGMSAYLIEQIKAQPNIEIITNAEVTEVKGVETEHCESVLIRDRGSGQMTELETSGLFVFIGAQAGTKWLDGAVALDEHGFVIPNHPDATWAGGPNPFATSMPGVYTIGDVRAGTNHRVNSVTGQAADVVADILGYLANATMSEHGDPVVSRVALGIKDFADAGRVVQQAFGERGYKLCPIEGATDSTASWSLNQPAHKNDLEIARFTLTRSQNRTLLDIEVPGSMVPAGRHGQQVANCWAEEIAHFLRRSQQITARRVPVPRVAPAREAGGLVA